MARGSSAAACVVVGTLLAACGGSDGPTAPKPQPGVRAVAGAGVTDTVLAQPLQALVVEVRGPDGQLARNTVVRFEAAPAADSTRRTDATMYLCRLGDATCGPAGGPFGYPGYPGYPAGGTLAVDTTDANGRAKATVRLGVVAGTAVVRLTVPEFGMLDSTTYTVRPGAATRVRFATADTALEIGAQATLRAAVVDRFGNARTEQPTMTLNGSGTLDLNAATGGVTARDIGTAWLVARSGTAADSASVRVVPAGRLVVWDGSAIRLIGFDGSASRTLATNVRSDHGVFPRFDATRTRVTFHTGNASYGGTPLTAAAVDTTGANRRDVVPAGLTNVLAVRQVGDALLFLAQRTSATSSSTGVSVWRADAAGTVTAVAAVPNIALIYGGGDISPDGKRLAYVAGASDASGASGLRVLDLASGVVTVLDPAGRSPRWSPTSDRVAYLMQSTSYGLDGTPAVIGADGSGRRALSSRVFSPGLAWSPDGKYIVGRSSDYSALGLRVVRVGDGVDVLVPVRVASSSAFGGYTTLDLYQPDWR